MCLYVQFSIAICVRFDKSSYTVNEDVGTFSPELVLCRPSPCCVTVYIELIELTSSTAATGELLNVKVHHTTNFTVTYYSFLKTTLLIKILEILLLHIRRALL